ncbi:MAG: protein-glutamate O-methyltransferase family protein [Desulfobacteraceae bacterium]|nr:protein-glutamate O-methyltransferase family protein [Desulfobacteraceae bacterium]
MKKKDLIPFAYGKNPGLDAWYTAFFLENHIDHYAYPTKVGSPKQLEFMVSLEDDERYYPCSDEMFCSIMSRKKNDLTEKRYKQIYQRILKLIDDLISSKQEKTFLKSLVKIKYEHEIEQNIIIPSRLEKRLYKIFVSRTHIEDPYVRIKRKKNLKISKVLNSTIFDKALNSIDKSIEPLSDSSLAMLKKKIDDTIFKRYLTLLSIDSFWDKNESKKIQYNDLIKIFNTKITGNGLSPLLNLLSEKKQKILWIANETGEIIADLAMIRHLTKQGHTIVITVKDSPYFTKVSLMDINTDPILIKELEDAHFIHGTALGKNDLVEKFKKSSSTYVISDGTKESLNLLLVTTTFSRVFKEVDFVISRGSSQKSCLIDSHFKFTQDFINITNEKKSICVSYKAKSHQSIKFSHQELEEKAELIIGQMRDAKNKNMTVMFYSGVIGSIPGKIDTAKEIMSVFINSLETGYSNLFVINPSNYYEPGMDADDLMYMWEIVQKSGFIDIWRFQTIEDISKSFKMLNMEVPPEWIGKDSTYSTGCTKEIKIAQEVLKMNPEMQLIGPSIDKFMRREEYGVGSMYDQRLVMS